MTSRTACPKCERVGFVRLERIIKAGAEVESFYCGACEHEWRTATDGSHRPVSSNSDRPDRSRSNR